MSITSTSNVRRTAPINRRRFLQVASATGAAGAATLAAPRLAFATPEEPGVGDVIVLVFMRGGADGLGLVAPYGMGSYYDLRPTIAVRPPGEANGGLALTHNPATMDPFAQTTPFALHPNMYGLHGGPWANGHLALVHATGMPATESDTRSHFESMQYWEAGSASMHVTSGFLNRYLAAVGANTGITGVGSGAAVQRSLAGPVAAYAVGDPTTVGIDGFSDRNLARSVLNAWYRPGPTDPVGTAGNAALAAVDRFTSVNWRDPRFGVHNGAQYPNTVFGHDLREVAQMIRANIGLRVACVDCGSWDTHENMGRPGTDTWFNRMTREFSDALAAFYRDLGTAMGEVTLATISEFGRTIDENGSGGTDHGRGSAMFVMGHNVRGGVYGDFVPTIADGPEGDLAVRNDYRQVLSEVLRVRGGAADTSAIFPTYGGGPALGLTRP